MSTTAIWLISKDCPSNNNLNKMVFKWYLRKGQIQQACSKKQQGHNIDKKAITYQATK